MIRLRSIFKQTPISFRFSTFSEKNLENTNFVLNRTVDIPDYSMKLYSFTHKIHKFNCFHFDTANKEFALAFLVKTLPSDNTGIPFILERLINCGSKHFPVKNSLTLASQNLDAIILESTILQDHMLFPFSAYTLNDFKQLRQILFDIILHPNLTEIDFLSEGFRYELKEQNLKKLGTVFETMKENFKSQSFVFSEKIKEHLFEGHPFQFCSGGIPSEIEKCSYQELLSFYSNCVQPENFCFVSFGKIDILENLFFIENQLLSKIFDFNQKNVKTENVPNLIKTNRRVIDNFEFNADSEKPSDSEKLIKNLFMEQKIKFIEGPNADYYHRQNKGSQVAISFIIPHSDLNQFDLIGLNIISQYLLHGIESLFYQKFIKTGIATGICDGAGLDTNGSHAYLTIGLKGVSNDNKHISSIMSDIKNTIWELLQNNFNSKYIDSIFQIMEVHSKIPKESLAGQIFNDFSSSLLFNKFQYVVDCLSFDNTSAEIRKMIKKQDFLRKLLIDYLILNPFKSEISLIPSSDLLKNEKLNEISKNNHFLTNLSTELNSKIITNSIAILEKEQKIKDLSTLPRKELHQISDSFALTPKEFILIDNITVMYSKIDTSNVICFKMKFDISDFSDDELLNVGLIEKIIQSYFMIDDSLEQFNFQIVAIVDSFEDVSGPRHIMVLEYTTSAKNLEITFNSISHMFCSFSLDEKRISKVIDFFANEHLRNFSNNPILYLIDSVSVESSPCKKSLNVSKLVFL